MTTVYIDSLSAEEAKALFNAFSDKSYLASAECNLNGHNSSVRLECYKRYDFFSDLAGYPFLV